MKKIALTLICFFSISLAQAQYDNWAVGFKAGEPTGVNVRKYFNNVNAIDVTIGSYGGIIKNFSDYRQGKYKNVGLSFTAHYLWHNPIFNSDKIQVYYGFGPQVNSRRYYPDNLSGQRVNYTKNISLGGSGVAGGEFFLPDGRLSIFLETGVYIELLPGPFYISPNVAGGIRLNL